MVRAIESLMQIACDYDALVFDQWGVLHNGVAAYPSAVEALTRAQANGSRLAVLSNSGKRSTLNAARITAMGFTPELFETVMTSGEALWHDIHGGKIPQQKFHAIERSAGDAEQWAQGLDVEFCSSLNAADAVLLMGLADSSTKADRQKILEDIVSSGLPLYCSNPDLASPRADGATVASPGAIAHAYQKHGGEVFFYGKPHHAIFQAMEKMLGTSHLLMVGDSLLHDIAGATEAGWDSLLIEGGLYAEKFASGDQNATLKQLCAEYGVSAPTYRMELLR